MKENPRPEKISDYLPTPLRVTRSDIYSHVEIAGAASAETALSTSKVSPNLPKLSRKARKRRQLSVRLSLLIAV